MSYANLCLLKILKIKKNYEKWKIKIKNQVKVKFKYLKFIYLKKSFAEIEHNFLPEI